MSWFSRTTRRSIPFGLLGMLALIWAVESFVVLNDRWFSIVEADIWRSTRVAADHLPSGGVLTLGDSQVLVGVSPITLETRLGQPVQCLALPGGQPSSTYSLLRRALQSGSLPAAIVLDFESQLLRDGRVANQRMWTELASFDECLDMATTLGDADAFASMLLAKYLPSYQDRLEIRANLMSALDGRSSTMPDRIAMSRRCRGMNRGAMIHAKLPPGWRTDYSNWCNPSAIPWKPSPANDAYTHRLLQLAQERQIPVFCVVMPMMQGLKEKSIASGIEPAYLAWLRGLQRRYAGLVVLDWSDAGYPDSVFIDGLHLDFEGSTSVAIALGEYLGPIVWGGKAKDQWVKMPPFRIDGSENALEHHVRSIAVVQAAAALRR